MYQAILSTLYALTHLIFTTSLRGRIRYPSNIDKETGIHNSTKVHTISHRAVIELVLVSWIPSCQDKLLLSVWAAYPHRQ